MSSSATDPAERTGIFNIQELAGGRRCPDCDGSGQLRIDSENITETFEVEKQTVITECPACLGTGRVPGG